MLDGEVIMLVFLCVWCGRIDRVKTYGGVIGDVLGTEREIHRAWAWSGKLGVGGRESRGTKIR